VLCTSRWTNWTKKENDAEEGRLFLYGTKEASLIVLFCCNCFFEVSSKLYLLLVLALID